MSNFLNKLFNKEPEGETAAPFNAGQDVLNRALSIEKKRFADKFPDLANLDNDTFQKMRLSGNGHMIAKLTIESQLNALIERYPELDGLFKVSINKNNGDSDVVITCTKGFEDANTQEILPTLWRRRMFMEHCILAGVGKIVFIDSVNNTYDFIEPEKTNYQSY